MNKNNFKRNIIYFVNFMIENIRINRFKNYIDNIIFIQIFFLILNEKKKFDTLNLVEKLLIFFKTTLN